MKVISTTLNNNKKKVTIYHFIFLCLRLKYYCHIGTVPSYCGKPESIPAHLNWLLHALNIWFECTLTNLTLSTTSASNYVFAKSF